MDVCVLQMLYFDRIDVPEGLDVNNTNASKECDICHHWYFLNYIVLSFHQTSPITFMIY